MSHHPTLSPSSFPSLMQCACFRSKGGSLDTDLGTLLHAATEAHFKGQPMPDGLELGDRQNCEWAAQTVRDVMDVYAPGAEVHVEKRLVLLDDAGNTITYGTPDFLAVAEDMVVVPDLKGCLDYEAGEHYYGPQYACYALMAMRMYGKRKAYCPEIDISPRVKVDYWFTYDEAAAIVQAVIERVNDPRKKPQPCFACRSFCGNLRTCAPINEMAMAIGQLFPGKLDFARYTSEIETEMPDPMLLSQVFTLAKVVQSWSESVQEIVKVKSENIDLPYYKREERPGRGVIKKVGEAFNCLDLKPETFQAALSTTPSKLGEVYAAAHSMDVKAAKKHISATLRHIIEVSEKSYQLKFVRDKLPTAVRNG